MYVLVNKDVSSPVGTLDEPTASLSVHKANDVRGIVIVVPQGKRRARDVKLAGFTSGGQRTVVFHNYREFAGIKNQLNESGETNLWRKHLVKAARHFQADLELVGQVALILS